MTTVAQQEIDLTQIVEVVTPFDQSASDSDKAKYEPLLKEIQGNILKSHGRNHAIYVFLQFKGDKDLVKKWIAKFSDRYVTSAYKQAEQSEIHKQGKVAEDGNLFVNFFLTSAGYEYLDYPYKDWPRENAFRKGMRDFNMQQELGDDSEQWHKEYQQEIHAMILLAADRVEGSRSQELKEIEQKQRKKFLYILPAILQEKVKELNTAPASGTTPNLLAGQLRELTAWNIAEPVKIEEGYVLRDRATGEEIEHFGFRDGVSQPLFLKRDIGKERNHSDFSNWDPRAPLSLVLSKDPLGEKPESYGSFLVFRKLEQNVGGWNRDVVRLARDLGVLNEQDYPKPPQNPEDPSKNQFEPSKFQNSNFNGAQTSETLQGWMDRLGLSDEERKQIALVEAYTMGRFRDGKPLVLSNKPSSDSNYHAEDNFNHNGDVQGSKCPFFAHTRKVNPRGDTSNPALLPTPTKLEEEKMHRIARRGIPYGQLPPDGSVPDGGVGLLFMCFQGSLASQFNHMQKAWAKKQDFVKRDVGTDVVIGVEKRDQNGRAVEEHYNFPTQWDKPATKKAPFKHWITMRGGEFFFAPSMSFLKSIAGKPLTLVQIRDGVLSNTGNLQFAAQVIDILKEALAEQMTITPTLPQQPSGDAQLPLHLQNILSQLAASNDRLMKILVGHLSRAQLLAYSSVKRQSRSLADTSTEDTNPTNEFLNLLAQLDLSLDDSLEKRSSADSSSASEQSIALLEITSDLIADEIDASKYQIAQLKEYKTLNWAIGINRDTNQLDEFAQFFGQRNLPFQSSVSTEGVDGSSAYDRNIQTLNAYIETLNSHISSLNN